MDLALRLERADDGGSRCRKVSAGSRWDTLDGGFLEWEVRQVLVRRKLDDNEERKVSGDGNLDDGERLE